MWNKIISALDWIGRFQTALWIKATIGASTGAIVSGIGWLLGATSLYVFGLFIAGCLIFLGVLIGWQNYRYANPGKPITINENAPSDLQRLDNETEIDRWHNKREIPLRIEFIDNSDYKFIGPYTGTGIAREHAQSYKIRVRNTTDNDIEDVQVWLTVISPMPDELNACIPIPLHVTNEPGDKYTMLVPAKAVRLVDVVSFYDRLWKFEILIHHTSTTVKREIFQGGDGHEIELTVTGKQTRSSSRRFKIGITSGTKKNLFMQSLPQTEEEAFSEAADAEFKKLQSD